LLARALVHTSSECFTLYVTSNKLDVTTQSFLDATPTLGQFQRGLKTSLFRLAYEHDW